MTKFRYVFHCEANIFSIIFQEGNVNFRFPSISQRKVFVSIHFISFHQAIDWYTTHLQQLKFKQNLRYKLGKLLPTELITIQRRRNRGALGARAPQSFSINKEVPFSCLEHAPFFLRKIVPSKCRAPKFEMLPTSL